jgi:hypothetical protein
MKNKAWMSLGILATLMAFTATGALADEVEFPGGPTIQMAYAVTGVGNQVIYWDCADKCLKRVGDKCCAPTIIHPE